MKAEQVKAVLEHKNWDPEAYHAKNHFQKELAFDFISKHIHFDVSDSVLDIGCGDGAITYEIAGKTNGKVIGIDHTPEMIKFAQTQYSEKCNLEFIEASADDFSLGKFSKIVSFNCLHWVKDQAQVLAQIKQSLDEHNDASRAYLLIPVRAQEFHDAIDHATEIAKSKGVLEGFNNPRQFLSIEIYETLVNNAGLELEMVESNRYNRTFSSAGILSEFIEMAIPQVKNMTADQSKTFMNDLITHYLEHIPKQDVSPPKLFVQMLEVILKLKN